MSRLTRLLSLSALAATAACGGKSPTHVAVAPEFAVAPVGPREQTADQQVNHALSRLTFGPRPGDVEKVRQMGVDRWIAWQLQPERMDDSRTEGFFSAFEAYHTSASELQRKYPPPAQLLNRLGGDRSKLSSADSAQLQVSQQGLRKVTTEIEAGRVARATLSERQLQEVMTDFWLNHFTVYIQKNPQERYHIAEYENETIRPNALGKFRTLLEAVAKSPAMLIYLDNALSQADSNRPHLVAAGGRGGRAGGRPAQQLPGRGGRGGLQLPPGSTPEMARQQLANRRPTGLNENYGRELLELHTLGVDGGYTQQDVINVARALTGWTVEPPQRGGGGFYFAPAMHDAGEKVVLGQTLKAGRGMEDGEQVLDIVSRHPSTARYISFKLARRFVSDVPPEALVDRAAATFRRTDGDIREVVRAIITSPEFFSRLAYKSKVKSPFEVVVSAMRALGAQPDSTPRAAQLVASLGEPIYGHQSPNGWPETGDQWMNTGAILNRINFGTLVAANRLPGASATNWAGAGNLRDAPLDKQVDGVIAAFLSGEASRDTRAILMSGENPFLKIAAAEDTTGGAAAKMVVPDADPLMMVPERRPPAPAVPGQRPPGPGQGPPGAGPLVALGFGRLPELKGLPLLVGLAIGSPEFQRR
jgi:uncharacterized protein (DUF1800 family)